MPGFDEVLEAIIDSFHAQSSKRQIPQISGPVDAGSIIDTESVPRVKLAKRNDPGVDVGPCGVPQYNFDLCGKSLQTVTIASSFPAQGEAQYDNVPPTCMVLSTVLDGECNQEKGSRPIPCGSACLLYTGVTDEDLGKLNRALGLLSH
ncbi:hypothetical protein F4781DRAFT_435636 [Annulohypoxylon bovei var. microspora]|nr:hypothetical protein F4781DRAFT_435636 [Annulohypoxylon bovei var. microspora]